MTAKLSKSSASARYNKLRGPVSMQAARKQNKHISTRAQAIKELAAAGIVTSAGNLRAKFKK